MKYKYVNIYQLIQQFEDSNLNEQFIRYLCGWDENVKYHVQELFDIRKLLKNIVLSKNQADGFLYGYVVPQLSKEFDLIKVSTQKCVDLELKSEPVSISKIKKQLVQNRHYLNLISSNTFLFTYISQSNVLYSLIGDEVMVVEFDYLLNILDFNGDEIDLDEVYTPNNILVSPLNTPQKFLDGKYLLTDQQQMIKAEIINYINDFNGERFFGLTGSAGTGKTLLIYDIAKELSNGKKILIVHSGLECSGHYYLSNHLSNVKIIEAKELRLREIKDVDIVIIDEAHRLYGSIFDKAVRWTKRAKAICIFSFDSNQKMSVSENRRNTDESIKEVCGCNIAELTSKVRTNKNIASFVKCLFDTEKYRKNVNFQNISLLYESDERKAVELGLNLEITKGYKYIAFTPSTINRELDYQDKGTNTHKVIGQEYDSVVMILNHYFYYQDNILCAKQHPNPDYLFVKLVFQGLTRARSKICLIVTREELLSKILKIVSN